MGFVLAKRLWGNHLLNLFSSFPLTRIGLAVLLTTSGMSEQNHIGPSSTQFDNRVSGLGAPNSTVRIFMTGDVMLGRGVDQILPYHVDPLIYEDFVKDARDYVKLAVDSSGPLPDNRPVDYVWGDAIPILGSMSPDIRIINLETAVTTNEKPSPNKGIQYRMHPKNVEVIKSAGIDCCVLSNNHVLDWNVEGLLETLDTLRGAQIDVSGAGKNIIEAKAPYTKQVLVNKTSCKILVYAGGHESSGVPENWAATATKCGVNYVDIKSSKAMKEIAKSISAAKQPGDVVVFSIHWGSNWGWRIEPEQKNFAYFLVDEAKVDIVHGHSSHHAKGFEIYKGKLIMYGAGDFLSDYEGIHSYFGDEFRDDLSFMYFADVDFSNGSLRQLQLVPMHLQKMRVNRATGEDEKWLLETMKKECAKFGLEIERCAANNGNGIFRVKM